jgi:cysteine desulfurase
MSKAIYLDYNATTPTDPRVVEAMLPYFTDNFGNSMSLGHEFGWQADREVENCRATVAKLLGCVKNEITWTSGATESNNWAIQGVMEAVQSSGPDEGPIHIISSPVEHSSVLMALEHARRFFKAEVEFIPMMPNGQIDPQEIEKRIRPSTKLVCVMWVQNEIGTIHPIEAIGQICRDRKVYLLSDATQAIGKIPIDLQKTHVDLMSFSAHKLYGPKGIGFLYHRQQNPHVELLPLIHGGGHERGKRSGTLNVPGIVGLTRALELGLESMHDESVKLRALRDQLWTELKAAFPTMILNGPDLADATQRSPLNLNVSFPKSWVPEHIPLIAFSRGSACYSGKTTTSHVLSALGLSEDAARRTLRLSLGRMTEASDITQAIKIIQKFIK